TSMTVTSCSGLGNGNGRKTIECRTLKIALVAPMPSASVSTAAAVKPGLFRSSFNPLRRSKRKSASQAPTRAPFVESRRSRHASILAEPPAGGRVHACSYRRRRNRIPVLCRNVRYVRATCAVARRRQRTRRGRRAAARDPAAVVLEGKLEADPGRRRASRDLRERHGGKRRDEALRRRE